MLTTWIAYKALEVEGILHCNLSINNILLQEEPALNIEEWLAGHVGSGPGKASNAKKATSPSQLRKGSQQTSEVVSSGGVLIRADIHVCRPAPIINFDYAMHTEQYKTKWLMLGDPLKEEIIHVSHTASPFPLCHILLQHI